LHESRISPPLDGSPSVWTSAAQSLQHQLQANPGVTSRIIRRAKRRFALAICKHTSRQERARGSASPLALPPKNSHQTPAPHCERREVHFVMKVQDGNADREWLAGEVYGSGCLPEEGFRPGL